MLDLRLASFAACWPARSLSMLLSVGGGGGGLTGGGGGGICRLADCIGGNLKSCFGADGGLPPPKYAAVALRSGFERMSLRCIIVRFCRSDRTASDRLGDSTQRAVTDTASTGKDFSLTESQPTHGPTTHWQFLLRNYATDCQPLDAMPAPGDPWQTCRRGRSRPPTANALQVHPQMCPLAAIADKVPALGQSVSSQKIQWIPGLALLQRATNASVNSQPAARSWLFRNCRPIHHHPAMNGLVRQAKGIGEMR